MMQSVLIHQPQQNTASDKIIHSALIQQPQENVASDAQMMVYLPWNWHPFRRHMLPDSYLFIEGDKALCASRKMIPFDESVLSDLPNKKDSFVCGVHGCMQSFSSIQSYENHYSCTHSHVCSSCHRTFPSDFLLDLHIQENHDVLFIVLSDKQNMYRCLVESCLEKFSSLAIRHNHLIKIHKYPSNFRFDSRNSSKKGNRKSQSEGMDVDTSVRDGNNSMDTLMRDGKGSVDVDMLVSDNIASDNKHDSQSSDGSIDKTVTVSEVCGERPANHYMFVNRVPSTLSFGHDAKRGFRPVATLKKSKHSRQGKNLTERGREYMDMTDLKSALNHPN